MRAIAGNRTAPERDRISKAGPADAPASGASFPAAFGVATSPADAPSTGGFSWRPSTGRQHAPPAQSAQQHLAADDGTLVPDELGRAQTPHGGDSYTAPGRAAKPERPSWNLRDPQQSDSPPCALEDAVAHDVPRDQLADGKSPRHHMRQSTQRGNGPETAAAIANAIFTDSPPASYQDTEYSIRSPISEEAASAPIGSLFAEAGRTGPSANRATSAAAEDPSPHPVNIAATVSSVSPSGLQSLVNSINQQSAVTGVSATVDANNHLVLTQAQGDNISITGFAGTGTLAAGGTSTVTLGTGGGQVASATIQGVVTLQSNQTFSTAAAISNIGLNTNSALSTLAGVNVGTSAGANSALNVVDFALQQLENIGGQLGAIQQRLEATASNLQTNTTNLTAARSVVQDANIPSVTSQLTQEEILQQAGVSALAQSHTLQQAFLKLLQ